MYGPYTINYQHSDNGGWWEWGSEYTEGWFYHTSGPAKREIGSPAAAAGKMVRDVKIPEHMHPGADPHIIQLLNGTEVKADRVIYIKITAGKDGKNETTIEQDLHY